MTEAEWKELAILLARKVMGWQTWNDFSIARQERIKRGYGIKPMRNWRGALILWWKPKGELKAYQTIRRDWWQPHNRRKQAMNVLEALRKHFYRCIIELPYEGPYRVTLQGLGRGLQECHTELPKAICLAAKAWLDECECPHKCSQVPYTTFQVLPSGECVEVASP